MPNQTPYQCYQHWDIKPSPILPRSRLFRLEPIGIGTAEVESLSSYIARLAMEHCVSPRKLLCKEALATFGKHTTHYSASPGFSASLINGMGGLASIAVTSFEQLTLRYDLRYTTLLMWKNIISPYQLMRTNRAWCSSCYEENLDQGLHVYDLLLWTLRTISICHIHQERLNEICHHCNRSLPFLATFYRPGYCSWCRQWLGFISASKVKLSETTSMPIAELSRQLTAIHLIGKLLSSAPTIESPLAPASFRANLAFYIYNDARRSINLFSDLVGIWSGTIRRLLRGQTKLRIEVLNQICSRLNIPPTDLLVDTDSEESIKRQRLINEQDIPFPKEIIPWSQVRDRLKSALKEHPPPSMESLARHIGYYSPRLQRHFPKLCERISARYKEHLKSKHPPPKNIQRVFRLALKEYPPPSLQGVLRRLGCRDTGTYYYINYRELCLAISQRYRNYRNKPFNNDVDYKRLQSALVEEPPPSFSEVVKRLGHSREFVRRKFPELSKAVTCRFLHYQAILRKEKAEKLRHAIRKAVKQIIASGLYVSEAKVKAHVRQHLPRLGRGSLFKEALNEVKLEMGLIK